MKRKAVSCLLVLAALVTMIPTIPTMAAENPDNETPSTQTTTETGTQNSVVKYDQASAFTVTIPKSIALSSSKSAEYTVKVHGDVIGNEIITVTPDTSVILSDANGKDPVTGDISQEKTEFSSTEVNARSGGGTATGSILANNLTSGDWSGNFKFVIGTNQIGNGTAITSENLATYGIKTTGDVVIPEYVTDDDNTRHAVTGIGDYAFRDCNEMTSVTIADSVTEIGTGAFVNCSRLSKAAVPNSVRSIGNSTFDGCTSLSSISYNGNEYDLSNIEPAFVENGVSVGSHAFEHSYNEPVYTWSEDNSTCTATKTCSECHDVVTEAADVSTKITDATCTNEGLNTYTATFKNSDFETQTKTSKISAKGHKSVSANNAVAATCTTDGKESDTVCSVCGVTLAIGKTVTKTGHSYGTPTYNWSKDKSTCTATRTCSVCSDEQTETVNATSKVTKAATCTGTGVTTYTAKFTNTAFAAQTSTSSISAVGHKSVSANNAVAATCTTDGKESDTVCSVCGVTLATGKTIEKTGHKYGTPTYNWSKNKSTCTATRTCSVCSDEQTETVNTTSKVTKAATCTGTGVTTYTAKFTNTAFAAQTTTSSISAVGHKSVSANNAVAATCTTDGKESDTVCSVCGVTLATGKTITKTGHSYGTPTYAWSADGKTCTAKRVCTKNSSHVETEKATITNKVKTPATCMVKGTTTYTATFKNTAFKTQTKDIQDIAALGHKYGTPTYTWSKDGKTCVAKRVCANNGTHIETENGTITNKVKTPATCTVKGTRTYTATFKNTAFKTQAKDIQDIAALGHKYGTPTYTWSNDGKTCIAKRVCANEGTHIETENGTITNKVKTPATYTTKGTTTYTATFKNTAFKAQTKDIQNIPVLEKLTGSVVLSATSGTISYPAAGSFTITSNKSNGTLSVKSSNPNVATAALDGNTVTVIPGTTAGSAIITVTSAATTSYKAASANYSVTVKSGTLPITAKAYSGTYDGKAHSASVTSSVSGVTFKYGTAKGTYNLGSMPTYTNAGTYIVYYQATKAGYTTFEGSVKTVIQKKATTTSLSSANGVLYVTTTGDGTITAQSSDPNIIESVTVNDKTITCMPKKYGNAGTATITVTVGETTNYKASSDTYNVSVSNRLITNSSLSFWHPDNKYEFGYLNGSGQYVVDGGSMWHCVSLIPITTSGYYYIVGRTGGAPRSCLYNDASRNSLYQSFESSDGYYTYIPAGKYLGSLLFRDEGFNALDLRFVTFSK